MQKNQKMPGSKTSKKNICSGCKKPKPSNCVTKTCISCIKRAAQVRENARNNKIECVAIKDDGTKCTNKVHKDCGNKYCAKHKKEWLEEQEAKGKNVRRCNSRIRCDPDKPGIKAILPTGYAKKKCEACLIKEQQQSKERRENRYELNKKTKNIQYCLKCGTEIQLDKIMMTTKGDSSLYCEKCFDQRKNVEKNRGKRDRKNYYKKFNYYLVKAEKRGLDFEISKDEFEKVQNNNCYYCGIPEKKYILGIDRLNNSKGYIKHNIVACCEMCNMMKNTLNESTFILICAHIANFNNFRKLKSYSKIFNNYKTNSYSGYKHSAKIRNLEFEISKKEYEIITNGDPCYLCGRYTNENHCNGIDRVDNSKGYVDGNCKSCCGDCNIMKKKLEFNDFRFKCAFIADNHKNRLDELFESWVSSRFIKKRERNNINKDLIIEI